jgi:hypothetical protein
LGERHFRDDREHDLLAFGGVGVLLVLVEPGLQRRCRFPGGVFSTRCQIVSRAVSEDR